MSILKTEILTKAFGELRAVDEVSVGFQEGEITSIIGPNGAGKTTFFNLITGRLRPSSGAVYLKEENITGLPPHKILRRGIGRSFQITNIFPGLTTFENVRIGILAYNGKGSNLFSQVSKMNEMNELMKSLCETCSEPLFLSKQECRNWIENKMKQGYMVCRCCGAKQTPTSSPSSSNSQMNNEG